MWSKLVSGALHRHSGTEASGFDSERLGGEGGDAERMGEGSGEESEPGPLSAQHAASTWMSYTGLEEGMAANCR